MMIKVKSGILCSVCLNNIKENWNFCPHCSAKLKEPYTKKEILADIMGKFLRVMWNDLEDLDSIADVGTIRNALSLSYAIQRNIPLMLEQTGQVKV